MGANDKEQSRVKIRGIAHNAKGGAVVVTSDGNPIYIDRLDGWKDEFLGSEVEVIGRLISKKHIPDPVIDDSGAISQGAWGNQDVIQDAKWSLMKKRK